MQRIVPVVAALAVASCVATGAVVRQEEPVTITVVPVPSGGAPMYFPTRGPGFVPDELYVGYPGLGSIEDAALLGDVLAVLGTSGRVMAVSLSDGERRVLADHVLDIAAAADRLWFVRSAEPVPERGDPPAYASFAVSSWDGRTIDDRGPITVPGADRLQALVVADGAPLVVLAQSVFRPAASGDGWDEIVLDRALAPSSRGDAALVSTGALYVGSDLGEFGGGLQRVDLATGAVDNLCRQPEGMCENVSAIVPDPRHPGCVIVAEGLWHMVMSSGRVVRVCDDRAEVLLRRPLAKDPFGTGGAIFGTEEFADLAVTPDGKVWVSGMGAVYEIDGDRKTRHTLPPLEALDQLYAIRGFPGLLVLFDGAATTCGDTLLRSLPAGSAPPPAGYACGFMMETWSPMLVAAAVP